MRTFVAIEVPQEIRERMRELLLSLQRSALDLRWSRPEGLHITVKFLGEVSAEQLEAVKSNLQMVAAPAPFSIDIRGAGFFPNERAPQVLWLGIQAGPELGELAAAVENQLLPIGFKKEDRPFAPHLTLARTKSSSQLSGLRELLRTREPLEMGSFTAREFFLYESQMSRGGSIYHKIARFPLASTPPSASL